MILLRFTPPSHLPSMVSKLNHLFRRARTRRATARPIFVAAPMSTLIRPGTVTFVPREPHKPFVSVIGDFNKLGHTVASTAN